MSPIKQFEQEKNQRLEAYATDAAFKELSRGWLEASMQRKYVYNFEWMGRPIIQYPQDMVAVQELIWDVKPDVVIETGIAHGGSIIMSASLLALLDMNDAIAQGDMINPSHSKRKVIGVDIDIREHNREAIENHPMASRIRMIQGSSIDPDTVSQVNELISETDKVMVFLDSMHTHDHVMAELENYAPMVTQDSYCVVFDTFVEEMPKGFFSDRPWNVGDNPMTAINSWLPSHPEFVQDVSMERKLQVTVAPKGFLKRVSG